MFGTKMDDQKLDKARAALIAGHKDVLFSGTLLIRMRTALRGTRFEGTTVMRTAKSYEYWERLLF